MCRLGGSARRNPNLNTPNFEDLNTRSQFWPISNFFSGLKLMIITIIKIWVAKSFLSPFFIAKLRLWRLALQCIKSAWNKVTAILRTGLLYLITFLNTNDTFIYFWLLLFQILGVRGIHIIKKIYTFQPPHTAFLCLKKSTKGTISFFKSN